MVKIKYKFHCIDSYHYFIYIKLCFENIIMFTYQWSYVLKILLYLYINEVMFWKYYYVYISMKLYFENIIDIL